MEGAESQTNVYNESGQKQQNVKRERVQKEQTSNICNFYISWLADPSHVLQFLLFSTPIVFTCFVIFDPSCQVYRYSIIGLSELIAPTLGPCQRPRPLPRIHLRRSISPTWRHQSSMWVKE